MTKHEIVGRSPRSAIWRWAKALQVTIKVLLAILVALLSVFQALAAPDLAKVIHYTAPTNFFGGSAAEARSDPGDNPMSLNGSQVFAFKERYDYRHPSDIRFKLGLACAYVGPGKVLEFLPASATSLKEDMATYYKGQFPTSSPVSISKINGLNAVSFTAARPPGPVQPYFLHFCWLQIETNIVLKITAVSSDIKTFQNETNSLQTLQIDKASLLQILTSASR